MNYKPMQHGKYRIQGSCLIMRQFYSKKVKDLSAISCLPHKVIIDQLS